HCCPAAIAPHVEWAIAGVLGRPVRLQWTGQPVAPSHLRAEADWSGPIGTGARIAASLRAWPMLVFEITEDRTAASDGERRGYVPGGGFPAGAFRGTGDMVVGEERLRGPAGRARPAADYAPGLAELLGAAGAADLEPYRHAGEGAPVPLLPQVG